MNTDMKESHSSEVRAGKRFRFGGNWKRFLRVLNDERILEAENSLKEYLGVDDLRGRTFIDIGSGSGLFSLVARRLGARVLSFDFDTQSVECTAELKRRYFPDDPTWKIIQGSVLDAEFIRSLGTFDVVYSWGVLHHTGAMWQALENAKLPTKPNGKLFIAIYNDCGEISKYWMRKKVRYNRLPRLLKTPYAIVVWTPIEFRYFAHQILKGDPGGYFRLWTQYKKSRGMSRWHDMIDWIGGLPYEYATSDQLVEFYRADGFKVDKLVANNGYGCHQIVFTREG